MAGQNGFLRTTDQVFGSFPDTLQGVCHISSHQVYFIVPFCSTYFVLSLVPNTSRTPAHLYLTAGLWIKVPRWLCHHHLQRETWAQQARSLTHGGTVGGGLPRHAASDQLSANIHVHIKLHPALRSCVLHAKGSILTNPSTSGYNKRCPSNQNKVNLSAGLRPPLTHAGLLWA